MRLTHSGFTLLEVLIALTVVAVGLLGLARLQGIMVLSHLETTNQPHAQALLADMVSRIEANGSNAGSYVTANSLGTGSTDFDAYASTGCPAETTTGYEVLQRDQCQWDWALKGRNETMTGGSQWLGGMENARGCIYSVSTSSPVIVRVVVVWQGATATVDTMASVSPGSLCGQGSYGTDDTFRRGMFADVVIPLL
ncbi:MAG: type IV pilus modification protein PilV [Magnetococcales bacterium]|nr:type IV pilus modification protein PilV [Magnetococcales bacterium]